METSQARPGEWVEEHHENGQLKMRASLQEGQLTGYCRLYEETGELILWARYFQGQLHGRFGLYTKDQLTQVAFYVQGKKQGKTHYFSSSGRLIATETYANDQLHGEAIYYHEDGRLAKKAHYHQGVAQEDPARKKPHRTDTGDNSQLNELKSPTVTSAEGDLP